MTDTVVIVNPTAGNVDSSRDWQERLESIIRDCPIRVTSHPGEAEALARRATEEGFSRIVAAGGDGTVNHVANGIAGSNLASAVRGILFDSVGTFGNQMLVTTNGGQIYRVTSTGAATLLASTGVDTEGLDIALQRGGHRRDRRESGTAQAS